jgi:3-hydroxy-9,10-secoandrosta-1,3,5(10)-triene-9,17-dione monooxygenase reductase component
MALDAQTHVDTRTLRQTLGHFVTGVTIVAADGDGGIHAMTANSFTSLSLEPPLILFCAGKESRAGQVMQVGRGFSVNILREQQRDLSTYFAGAWKENYAPPFSFTTWDLGGALRAPRLDGSAAALGCVVHTLYEGGDHWIVVGDVVAVERTEDPVSPLVFYRGRYASLEP